MKVPYIPSVNSENNIRNEQNCVVLNVITWWSFQADEALIYLSESEGYFFEKIHYAIIAI